MKVKFLATNILIGFIFCFFSAQSQDDLMAMLEDEAEQTDEKVIATFKTMRLVNAHTIEMVKKKTLDFRITHRFGNIGGASGGGGHTLYGFDNAEDIRFSFDYGITENLQIGIGRSKRSENIDGSLKYKLLSQSEQKIPLSLVWFSNIIGTPEKDLDGRYSNSINRISYIHQLILARKFTNGFSFLLSPTISYRNMVVKDKFGLQDEHLLTALGAGFRIKLSQRVAFIADYYYIFSNYRTNHTSLLFSNPLGIGVEIETGGHVFHVTLTNASGIIEHNYLTTTQDSWQKIGIKLGFNISRVFNIGSY